MISSYGGIGEVKYRLQKGAKMLGAFTKLRREELMSVKAKKAMYESDITPAIKYG